MTTIREIFEKKSIGLTGDNNSARNVLIQRGISEHQEHLKAVGGEIKKEILESIQDKIQKTQQRIEDLTRRIQESLRKLDNAKTETQKKSLNEKIINDEYELEGRKEFLNKLIEEKTQYENISVNEAINYSPEKYKDYLRQYENATMTSYWARGDYDIKLREAEAKIKASPEWKTIKEKTGLTDKASYGEIMKAIEEYNKKAEEYNKRVLAQSKDEQKSKDDQKKEYAESRESKAIPIDLIKQKELSKEQIEMFEKVAKQQTTARYGTMKNYETKELSKEQKIELDAYKLANEYSIEDLVNMYSKPNLLDKITMIVGTISPNLSNKYDILSKAIETKISLDYQKRIEENFGRQYSQVYQKTIETIENAANNPNISAEEFNSIRNTAINEYEAEVKKIESRIKDFTDAYQKKASEIIADKNILANLRKINLINTASITLISAGLSALSTTAFATTAIGKGLTYGIIVLGGYGLSKSLWDTATILGKLNENGMLTKERAIAVAVPPALYFVAAISSGYVAKKYMTTRLEPISKELRYNLFGDSKHYGQLINNEQLMNSIFSPKNMKRGYAEVAYRGYNFRIPVNDNLYSKVKLAQLIYNEGTKVELDVSGAYLKKEVNVEKLRQISKKFDFLFKNNELVINENTLSAIMSREFTKITKIPVKTKTMLSIGGRYKGKPIEFLFDYTGTSAKLRYVSVKTQISDNNVYLVRIASIGDGYHVKPVKDFLVFTKMTEYKSFQKGDYIVSLAKNEYLLKQILGSTNKDLVDLNTFLKGIFSIKKPYFNRGDAFFGEQKTLMTKWADDIMINKKDNFGIVFKDIISREFGSFKGHAEKIDLLGIKSKTSVKSTKVKSLNDPLDIKSTKIMSDNIKFFDDKRPLITATESKLSMKTDKDNILFGIAAQETKPSSLLKSGKVTTQDAKVEPFFSVDQKNIQTQKAEISPMLKTKMVSLNISKEKLDNKSRNELKDLMRPLEITKTNVKQNTSTEKLSKQITRDITETAKPDINIRVPEVPTISPPSPSRVRVQGMTTDILKPQIPKGITIKTKKEVNAARKKEDPFYYEVKRLGQWRTSKAFDNLDKALKEASSKVKSTLAASFRIKKGEKVEDISFIDKDFYKKATKEGPVFIEKRQKRLDMPGEIFEIQKARKKKLKKAEDFWLK